MPDPAQARVRSAIRELAANPRPVGAIKMKGFGRRNVYRIRVGQYRVAYEIHDRKLLVIVAAAGSRGHIYSLLNRRLGK
jgi:mRNA interferase RelE/StbE